MDPILSIIHCIYLIKVKIFYFLGTKMTFIGRREREGGVYNSMDFSLNFLALREDILSFSWMTCHACGMGSFLLALIAASDAASMSMTIIVQFG